MRTARATETGPRSRMLRRLSPSGVLLLHQPGGGLVLAAKKLRLAAGLRGCGGCRARKVGGAGGMRGDGGAKTPRKRAGSGRKLALQRLRGSIGRVRKNQGAPRAFLAAQVGKAAAGVRGAGFIAAQYEADVAGMGCDFCLHENELSGRPVPRL